MIQTEDLTKQYGQFTALKNLKLNLTAGDLFGFIGPNGSGKTTTMKILATLLQPTYGEAYICGHSIYTQPKEIRMLIGYMPDFFGVYDDMTVLEYLEFFAAAYRIKGEARRKVCEENLELVDLSYKRDAMANSLSRGMTQRLGLARVLLHDPQVLLLDEPASGLDPRARIEMRNLLKVLGTRGKTIMVSSHILPELADICNKVGIIERGELLVNADVSEVMRKVRDHIIINIEVVGNLEDAAKIVEQHSSVKSVEIIKTVGTDTVARTLLKVAMDKDKGLDDYCDLPNLLIEHGFKIRSFKEEEINLETAFMTLTKGITA
ncbi:MAG: ABC transporter ATP-binding protein [Planctomycetaceae bacterium]|nr:ABC transporter ATP-binding protein [Planctomycetaceae bacterium]